VIFSRYSQFFYLWITRVVTAVSTIIILAVFMYLSRVRKKYVVKQLASLAIIVVIVLTMLTLVLRNDTSCSPMFMILLWINMYFLAPYFAERSVIGSCLIITHTFVWLFALHRSAWEFLNSQTLNYILGFFLDLFFYFIFFFDCFYTAYFLLE
jgi:hypothetical protein